MGFSHESVLLHESIEALNIRPDGVYVDGTLGGAGHSEKITEKLGPNGRLIGIDRDETALSAAKTRLSRFGDIVTLVHGNFRDIEGILQSAGVDGVDGMLFDLGVSSPQLDESDRGFSYMADAPLDMRMDKSSPISAYTVINEWPESEIKRVLFELGEERYSAKIASAIAKRRSRKPIGTTAELTEIIKSAMPAAALREKQHPAKRSFQAIRIAVNDELGSLKEMLDNVVPLMRKGGRLAVISFHSLEDRLVKQAMSAREKGCTCPPNFPMCVCGFVPTLRVLSKKPIIPNIEEIERNPRSRSAKLRVAERV